MPEHLTNGHSHSNGHNYEMHNGATFVFTSESVGEGHPGQYLSNYIYFHTWDLAFHVVCRSKTTTPSDLTYKLMVHVSAVRFSVSTCVRIGESPKWSRVRLRLFSKAVFCCVISVSWNDYFCIVCAVL